jgi:hypothetical protein
MVFRGIDQRGVPFSFFKDVSVAFNKEKDWKKLKGEPYKASMLKKDSMRLKLSFYGWLKEPDYILNFDKECKGILEMIYDPKAHEWVSVKWKEEFKF